MPLSPDSSSAAITHPTSSNEDVFEVDVYRKGWYSGLVCLIFCAAAVFASSSLLRLTSMHPNALGTDSLQRTVLYQFISLSLFHSISVAVLYSYVVICLLFDKGAGLLGPTSSHLASYHRIRNVILSLFGLICLGTIFYCWIMASSEIRRYTMLGARGTLVFEPQNI